MAKTLIAADLGAESGRVLLGHFDNGILRLDDIHRFPNRIVEKDGHLHWEIHELFANIKQGIAKAAEQAKAAPDSIGIDTWGLDFGLLDEQGELIGLPYAYRDPHTDGVMDRVFDQLTAKRVYDETGIQFMAINSLYHLVAERAASPSLLDKAETLLFTPDLLNYWLSGVAACEYSIASTSQCLDMRTGAWASFLAELDIPEGLFAGLVQPGTVLGPLTGSIQRETGAGPITVIAVAGHDTGSAVVAVPFDPAEAAYMSSGTWSLLGVELDAPLITDESRELAITNEGGAYGTIRFLKNIAGLWLIQECRRAWESEGNVYDYPALTRMAAEAPPFTAVIDADDPRFTAPGDMPGKIQALCRETGQVVPETHGSIVRTALEGLALKYRLTMNRIEHLTGRTYARLNIVGGGTQNLLLNQMTADAIGRQVVTGPIEGTAIGNMLVQLIALGELEDVAAAREVVKRSFPIDTFAPEDTAAWDQAWAAYQRLYE